MGLRFRVNIFYPTPARGRIERLHVTELRNAALDVLSALADGARFSVRDSHLAREMTAKEVLPALDLAPSYFWIVQPAYYGAPKRRAVCA